MKTLISRLCVLLVLASLPCLGEDLASQLDRLGDPSSRVRSAATRWLIAASGTETNELPLLEACIARYAATDDVEILARLDEIMTPVVNRRYYNRPLGFLGARLDAATIARGGEEVPAVSIGSVVAGYAAEKAGFKEGDLILSMNGKPVSEDGVTPFISAIQRTRPGTKVDFQVRRGEEDLKLQAEITRRPREEADIFGFGLGSDRPPFEAFYEEWKAEAVRACKDGKKPILPE